MLLPPGANILYAPIFTQTGKLKVMLSGAGTVMINAESEWWVMSKEASSRRSPAAGADPTDIRGISRFHRQQQAWWDWKNSSIWWHKAESDISVLKRMAIFGGGNHAFVSRNQSQPCRRVLETPIGSAMVVTSFEGWSRFVRNGRAATGGPLSLEKPGCSRDEESFN